MAAVRLAVQARPPAVSSRPPPPRRRCRRLPVAAGSAGDPQGSPVDPQALLQRAAALRAQQKALEREAAQLAAALEGLPAAEQRAVLAALAAQQQGGGVAARQGPGQQHHEEVEEEEEEGEQQQLPRQAARPPAYAAGDAERAPAWEAALPPELRQVIQDAGMADTLRQHAAAVRAAVGEEGEATGAGNGELVLTGSQPVEAPCATYLAPGRCVHLVERAAYSCLLVSAVRPACCWPWQYLHPACPVSVPCAAGAEEEVEAIARIIEEGGELPPLVPDGYVSGLVARDGVY